MKQQLNGVTRHNSNPFQFTFWSTVIFAFIIIAFATTGCQKQMKDSLSDMQSMNAKNTQADVLNSYTGLSTQTTWELQQARAATARYRNFDNAIKDGYADINVVVPNMGHH